MLSALKEVLIERFSPSCYRLQHRSESPSLCDGITSLSIILKYDSIIGPEVQHFPLQYFMNESFRPIFCPLSFERQNNAWDFRRFERGLILFDQPPPFYLLT